MTSSRHDWMQKWHGKGEKWERNGFRSWFWDALQWKIEKCLLTIYTDVYRLKQDKWFFVNKQPVKVFCGTKLSRSYIQSRKRVNKYLGFSHVINIISSITRRINGHSQTMTNTFKDNLHIPQFSGNARWVNFVPRTNLTPSRVVEKWTLCLGKRLFFQSHLEMRCQERFFSGSSVKMHLMLSKWEKKRKIGAHDESVYRELEKMESFFWFPENWDSMQGMNGNARMHGFIYALSWILT